MTGKSYGPLTTWTAYCVLAGGILALLTHPAILILIPPVWLAGVGPCYVLARRKVKRAKPPAKAVKPIPPTPPEVSKAQLAAQAKKDLLTAKEIAKLIDDEGQRQSAVAEAEAKFRRRMRNLMG